MNQRSNGPLLLLACLPGEFHEVGLLLFALAAVNFGYRVLVLGANMPLEQLPGVMLRKTCDGVVLSGASRPARSVLDKDLPALVDQTAVPVFVGGRIVTSHQEKIEAAGAICLSESIGTGLRLLSGHVRTGRVR